MHDTATVFEHLKQVRAACPLVHNITNFVVMNTTANALLALGASPIMAHAPQELDELVGIVGALVLNIGTLSEEWVESMVQAGQAANERGIPVILDPVGAGASRLRTGAARRIVTQCAPAVVRGNGSEIIATAGALEAMDQQRLAAANAAAGGGTRGVDSAHSGAGIEDVAQALARKADCVVTVSGATDVVADGARLGFVTGGSPLMPKVTGLGCTATAVVGAFAAVLDDPFEAALSGMAVMSAAGAVAAARSQGPGTLQLHFYDALYALTEAEIAAHVRVERR